MNPKKSPDRPLLSPRKVGLCADCRHRRIQYGGRSLFIRCALSRSDPVFARYPRLPVTACDGYRVETR